MKLMTYPNTFTTRFLLRLCREMLGNMGATAVGATIYFGSEESSSSVKSLKLQRLLNVLTN